MKKLNITDRSAPGILKKERDLSFMESPDTDWVFEDLNTEDDKSAVFSNTQQIRQTESSEEIIHLSDPENNPVPENSENNNAENSDFDPSENMNEIIYGPPEELDITDLFDPDDWI